MSSGKQEDGGVLYGETPEDDEDDLPDVAEAGSAPAIEWSENLAAATGLTGAELIGEYVKQLPNSPGVYRMFDAKGDVLYVGKARSLKKRVGNYAQGRVHSNRIAHMVAATTAMEFVTTRTETEALLLEANLIKRLRPRFNVLLRDDKSFPYILLRRSPCPRDLQASRRPRPQGRLFRAVCLGCRGFQHDQFAAARLSLTHLHRQRL